MKLIYSLKKTPYLIVLISVLNDRSFATGVRSKVREPVMMKSTPPSVAIENDVDRISGASSEYISLK